MLRVALVMQLVFTTVAGPWLCCCSAARVVAGGGGLFRPGRVPTREAEHPCCRSQDVPPGSRGGTAGGEKNRPGPGDTPRCPCKGPSVAALPPASEPEGNPLPAGAPSHPSVTYPTAPPAVDRSAAAGRREARCVLSPTADTLLFAHHNLRC